MENEVDLNPIASPASPQWMGSAESQPTCRSGSEKINVCCCELLRFYISLLYLITADCYGCHSIKSTVSRETAQGLRAQFWSPHVRVCILSLLCMSKMISREVIKYPVTNLTSKSALGVLSPSFVDMWETVSHLLCMFPVEAGQPCPGFLFQLSHCKQIASLWSI